MKRNILIILAVSGLVLTLVPSMLAFSGIITIQNNKLLMLIGMILWFSTASVLMKSSK
jgi:uncharacterized membrane protein (Fun14 family)